MRPRPAWADGLGVLILALLVQLPAWAGWLEAPGTRLLANPFTGGQVWAADLVGEALWRGDWPDPTDQAGFPGERAARFVAWPVLLLAAALRPLLSAGLVVHLACLLGPALGGVAAWALFRTLSPQGRPALQIAGAVLYAVAPVTLGAALSGQVENTQTWVLPGLLLLTWAGARWGAGLLGIPLLWAAGALTSPYLAMLASFGACWIALLRRREGLRAALPLALAIPGLWLASRYLDLGAFDPATVLYRPSYTGQGWPELWVRPLPVASLDGLLLGTVVPQVKAMVLHQPYLGLPLLLGALALGGERARWGALALGGALLALGPRLAWGEGPLSLGGHGFLLPAQALRWVDHPLAHGGQYYRASLLGVLGLAGMLAAGRPRRALALAALALVLVGGADALRSVRSPGLPWPTWEQPTQAWARWAELPEGAILHLPMHSTQLPPCHPLRLAGRPVHGRAMSDLPRAWTEVPQDPLLARTWAASLASPQGSLPGPAELAQAGFALAVLDLPAIPERRGLLQRLTAAWGPPDGQVQGLAWWAL